MSPSKKNLWRNDSIPSGVKRYSDKTDPEINLKKIKSTCDDPLKEEDVRSGPTLKKKMQNILFGDLEDSD